VGALAAAAVARATEAVVRAGNNPVVVALGQAGFEVEAAVPVAQDLLQRPGKLFSVFALPMAARAKRTTPAVTSCSAAITHQFREGFSRIGARSGGRWLVAR